jgi:hypothetical protein
MPARIVVGVDGSPESRIAQEQAIERARLDDVVVDHWADAPVVACRGYRGAGR